MNRRLRFPGLCAALLIGAAASHAAEVHDPMRPAGAPVAARPAPVFALKLEGVIAGSASNVAIVNGRLVRAGDSVAGARIIEVFATGVRYQRAGKIQTLSMPVVHANSNVRVARSPEAK
jgi:hypothetical protein